jgi:hypothetical protein
MIQRYNYNTNENLITIYNKGFNRLQRFTKEEFENDFIKPYGFIYKATNIINGKVYVGKTISDIYTRFLGHIKDSYWKLNIRRAFKNA